MIKKIKANLIFLRRIPGIIYGKTKYTNMKRKGLGTRFNDNLKWFKEHGYANVNYNLYGLDIKNFRDQDDYVEEKIITKKRNTINNKISPKRHKLFISHKPYFFGFINNWAPNNSLKLDLIFRKEKVFFPLSHSENTSNALLSLNDGLYLCNPVEKTVKTKKFVFEKRNKAFYLNDKKVDEKSIIEETNNKRYLVHSLIKQHKAFKDTFLDSYVTIRIDTERWCGDTDEFFAYAKFDVISNDDSSNPSKINSYVGIDIEKGTFKELGEYWSKENTNHDKKHPNSGEVYYGFEIPYWKECLALVKGLHPMFYGVPSIGWDIIISEDGPVIIDATHSTPISVAQLTNGGLKKKWDSIMKDVEEFYENCEEEMPNV